MPSNNNTHVLINALKAVNTSIEANKCVQANKCIAKSMEPVVNETNVHTHTHTHTIIPIITRVPKPPATAIPDLAGKNNKVLVCRRKTT